ncbi:hypothetical protein OG775_22470 [Streptomyces platensis]|uniref:hypothetical protein n=2 Tax=Streptomyces TaxID=1883 RepID=UPI00225B0AA2|nr:hypothetical protein [Streptomyces platensis]MCX4637858.1 hypothetical protein [Streptomyces platensis]
MLLPLAHGKTQFIEVVRITDPVRTHTAAGLVGNAVARWDGKQAQQTMTLIADLPVGEPYRCFTPGWGIRACSPTSLLFEIAFCPSCHGARLWGPALPAEQQHQPFNAESPVALELLRRFRSCVPA